MSTTDVGNNLNDVHQVIAQVGDKNGHPPYTIIARCGHRQTRKTGSTPLPDNVTAWQQDVTCEACRTATTWPKIG